MKEVSISNIKTPAIDIKEAIKKSKYFKKIRLVHILCAYFL